MIDASTKGGEDSTLKVVDLRLKERMPEISDAVCRLRTAWSRLLRRKEHTTLRLVP